MSHQRIEEGMARETRERQWGGAQPKSHFEGGDGEIIFVTQGRENLGGQTGAKHKSSKNGEGQGFESDLIPEGRRLAYTRSDAQIEGERDVMTDRKR